MFVRPIMVVLLGASVIGSCSAGGHDEIVLVSRQRAADNRCSNSVGELCWIEAPGQTFHTSDGKLAKVAAIDTAWRVESVSEGQVQCGDEMVPRRTHIFRGEPTSVEASRQWLTFDDGSRVQMVAESLTIVVEKCSETVGRWEGLDGTLEGRTGTYRWIDDSLQNKLVLTDTADD